MTRIAVAILAVAGLFAPSEALAQKFFNNPARSYGVGVGIAGGRGGYGPYVGPAIGAYPLYYPGFYGNGASMYGPPVPTYAPVPGTFGAGDHRVHQLPPFFGMGLGWWGNRSPSPRPRPNFDYNPVPGGIIGEPVTGMDAQLLVEVRVPIENAIVFVNDQATKQTGPVRNFASPVLAKDEEYQYHIRAEWIVNGKKMSQTKTISGKPGDRLVADFGG